MTFAALMLLLRKHKQELGRQNLVLVRVDVGRDLEAEIVANYNEVFRLFLPQEEPQKLVTLEGMALLGIPVRLVGGSMVATVAVERTGTADEPTDVVSPGLA